MQNRILIVGNRSYLGLHLQNKLKNSFSIIGTSRNANSSEKYIDFNNPNSFGSLINETFDIVLILASEVSGLESNSLNHLTFETNVIGYSRFLEHLIDNNNIKHVVFTSSMTVYNSAVGNIEENADTSCPPHIYGLSKKIGEEITTFKCFKNKIPFLCLRLPGIYGGNRNDGLIYNSIIKLKKNETLNIDLSNLIYWETIYIEDLCSVISKLLLSKNIPKGILNISYGEPCEIKEIIKYLINQTESLSEVNINGDQVIFYLDNTRLKQLIAFDYNLKKGISKYLKLLAL